MSTFRKAQLRRIFRVVNGGTPNSEPSNWDGDVPWATPVDVGIFNGGIIHGTGRSLSEAGLASGSSAVPSGSLILSTRAPIGYVAQVSERTAFNQGCRGLVSTEELDVRYFRYQLLAMSEVLHSRGQGSTFQELSSDGLAGSSIFIPRPAEQRAIADYLDRETARIDALIEKKQHLLGLLDERRMAVTADSVSGRFTSNRLVPSTLLWLPWRGANWRETKLTLVARLGSGHTPSRDHREWWEECKIPWVTTGEVAQLRSDRVEFLYDTREKISELGVANSSAEVHPKDTVVLCRTASAGYSGIMGTAMATSQDFATWTCGPLIRPRFLLLCLRAMRQDLLGRLAMGSTHQTIYMPDIEALRVPLPEVNEQDAIVDAVWVRLHKIDAAIDGLHRQIDLLGEHRHALITAAVTGDMEMPGVAA
ncbi:MAG: restriction endonuclease subunit S [Actinomycetota bacterium]|nr:restriction endonuclease subunit S [Actinomycetota bacterium]